MAPADVRFLPVDLTYFLRSGEPEVYDKHMAIFYANLVMNLVPARTYGVMAGHRDGEFIYTDIPGKNLRPGGWTRPTTIRTSTARTS